MSLPWDQGVTWRTDVVEPPTELVLPLAEVRDKVLRVANDSYDNSHIEALIAEASALAEQETGRALAEQDLAMYLDRFPCEYIRLARLPLIGDPTVSYVDTNGVTQTMDADAIQVVPSGFKTRARIYPAYGTTWPTTRCQPDAVTVTYTAGYQDVTKIPPMILTGIKLLVAELYEIRKLSVQGTNTSVPATLPLERFFLPVVG
jgi:uncharacterized phiE125 gp8 family phage protein